MRSSASQTVFTVLRDGLAVATLPTAQTDKSEVICYMVGREITDFYPRRKSEIGRCHPQRQRPFGKR